MNCTETEDYLAELLITHREPPACDASELPLALRGHLATCATCDALWREQRVLGRQLESLPLAKVLEPRPELAARAAAQYLTELRVAKSRGSLQARRTVVAAVVAATLLMALVLPAMRAWQWPGGVTTGPLATSNEAVERAIPLAGQPSGAAQATEDDPIPAVDMARSLAEVAREAQDESRLMAAEASAEVRELVQAIPTPTIRFSFVTAPPAAQRPTPETDRESDVLANPPLRERGTVRHAVDAVTSTGHRVVDAFAFVWEAVPAQTSHLGS